MSLKFRLLRKRFTGYVWVGIFTLVLEIICIWALLFYTSMSYIPAIIYSFLIITTASYVLYRKHCFFGTESPHLSSYVYFFILTTCSLLATIAGTYALVEWAHTDQIIARVLVGGIVAPISFVINGLFNFRVL